MFIDKKMSNRSFVPTNIISLLLLGIVSLVLWEFTRSSSLIRPAHGPFLALMVVLSLFCTIYCLVSFGFYFYDHDFSSPRKKWGLFVFLCLLALLYLVISLSVIFPAFSEARWDEGASQAISRYFDFSLGKEKEPSARLTPHDPEDVKWHWDMLLWAGGILLFCLICNIIYLPIRLRVAKEKGYDTESIGNLLASVAILLLVLLGLAKPSLYWWLGGLLLVLLAVRIPRLGPLHALLFALFQPFALLDSGLSKVKLLSTSVSTTSAISSEMKARSAGLHQTIRDEVREEFQQDIDQNTTVQTHKEQETEKTDRSI